MYYVYVLKSLKSKRFYIGMTNNLKRRLKEHNKGKTKSTKGYKPWELFYYENFHTIKKAREKELYLKSGIGREFIKNRPCSSIG